MTRLSLILTLGALVALAPAAASADDDDKSGVLTTWIVTQGDAAVGLDLPGQRLRPPAAGERRQRFSSRGDHRGITAGERLRELRLCGSESG